MFKKLHTHWGYLSLVAAFMTFIALTMRFVPVEFLEVYPLLFSSPLIVAMIWLEKKDPARKDWLLNQGDFLADLIHSFVLFPVIVLLSSWLNRWFFTGFSIPTFQFELLNQSLALKFLVTLLFAELFFYLIHRFAHENRFLWRFHRIHHGADRVYWANAARFHPFDLFLTMTLYFFPVYLMGANEQILCLFVAINIVTGLLEHANIQYASRTANRIFNTSELHRWHHSTVAGEYQKNYGKVLCVWDVFFRTWYYRETDFVKEVGTRDDYSPVSNRLMAQMKQPFIEKTGQRGIYDVS